MALSLSAPPLYWCSQHSHAGNTALLDSSPGLLLCNSCDAVPGSEHSNSFKAPAVLTSHTTQHWAGCREA